MTQENKAIQLESVTLDGEHFYKIAHADELRPFFMSVVSDSDHWMFIASNGGLSAGRKNSEYALFPYYTDDKITESAELTGSKTLIRVQHQGQTVVWEPLSERFGGPFRFSRHLYKNALGNKVCFEEINHDLELSFRYQWNFSDAFGFVRQARLADLSGRPRQLDVLDGIQNIVPYGVGSDLQVRASNLADAYKRSELDQASGLGIFALSAIIVDKAEPSEALKANVAFALGLHAPAHLLSSTQLRHFRRGGKLNQEEDVKAEKGAYFVNAQLALAPHAHQRWMIVADVNQSHGAVVRRMEWLNQAAEPGQKMAQIQQDIDRGTENLMRLAASADALQCSADGLQDTRHFANVLFNIMRGGIFDDGYQIERWDFMAYLRNAGPRVFERHQSALSALPEQFSYLGLGRIGDTDPDLARLAIEYLPLKFSRRHGDPSRPWNRFTINTRNEVDGSKVLDYEGNWRDIFQNWEALAHAYPAFIEGMIYKFVNASTFDGYNPYRVTKGGFDWETIEPDDPWSYIGYWGDHQLIYLLKFLEFAHDHQPDLLPRLLPQLRFVYANVPYKIKPYSEIVKNPKDTIDFDFALNEAIAERRQEMGSDGALLSDVHGDICRVSFAEKLLATVLAKLSNFVLEGGIWMNTQRPEWNDANNALVGNGVSVVTLCYLRRFMHFFEAMMGRASGAGLPVSAEMAAFYARVKAVFADNRHLLSGRIADEDRRRVLDQLGQAAGDFRWGVYQHAFSGARETLSAADLQAFAELSLTFIDHSLRANERPDHLYHGYNLLTLDGPHARIDYLSEMLEGQVAALSSGYLSAAQSLAVLDALKAGALFREDQYSYLLYPNKNLPGFLQKNTIPEAQLRATPAGARLADGGYPHLMERDVRGACHFNGSFKNAADLKAALEADGSFSAAEQADLLALYEAVFRHKAFTGRSGTFFGYEGLGSIYWHMVSKLRLAVLETCRQAQRQAVGPELRSRLLAHYYDIVEGIGLHKPPARYGAFPTDPYSHTPLGKGAQQPGMTGQVKEDILSRLGELGVQVLGGCLHFQPGLLRRSELLSQPQTAAFFDLDGSRQELALPENSLFFTYCQLPVVYALAGQPGITAHFRNGAVKTYESLALDASDTQKILNRTGEITKLNVFWSADQWQ